MRFFLTAENLRNRQKENERKKICGLLLLVLQGDGILLWLLAVFGFGIKYTLGFRPSNSFFRPNDASFETA